MAECGKKPLDCIVMILMIVGAINWGLVGLFEFNIVSALLGFVPILEKIVYILVGVAGVWGIFLLARCKKSSVS